VLSVYCDAGFSEEISLQNIFTFQILGEYRELISINIRTTDISATLQPTPNRATIQQRIIIFLNISQIHFCRPITNLPYVKTKLITILQTARQ
jgi:hypothetical protein